LAVAAEHPSMKGVLFDRPPVAEVAEGLFKKFGLEDRMTAVGGDYFIDSIGDGYDLVLAIATLNFTRHDIDPVMTKIHDALNPGGVFISFHDGLTHERTKPEVMVLPGLATSLRGMDMGLDQGFLAEAMLRAGFKSVRSRTVDTGFGPMDLDIGRKA
ncbi:MAG: methyltransferase, partial [Thermodesulfobacteriota bacterium]|nr:methyltransferase [Thermodesulfobacteriota bacterium]